MIRAICVLVAVSSAMGFAPSAFMGGARMNSHSGYKSRSESYAKLSMTLGTAQSIQFDLDCCFLQFILLVVCHF
jgi:hypothetical protein